MDYVDPNMLTLQNGGAGSEQYYARMLNPPVHPGENNIPMPRHYMLLDQRRMERVPRPKLMSPPSQTLEPITFSVNGWAGVRVRDILKGTVTIDLPNDLVFETHGWKLIRVSLEWPGYSYEGSSNPMHSRIEVRPGERYMTRQFLAREVCGMLFNFHKFISKHPISPGLEKWALTAGPEGIRLCDIVLLSMHYYKNVWVPELYVIE